MTASTDQQREKTTIEQIRFFLEHGKVDWALEALDGAQGQSKARLAAATVDVAADCPELFAREGRFKQWVEDAMALDPSLWERFARPWARAIAALSHAENPVAGPLGEGLIAAAPAAIHSAPMEENTVKGWLKNNLSRRHGDWTSALSELEAMGHHPQAALKDIPELPFAPDAALASLLHKLRREVLASSDGFGDAFEIIERALPRDKPALCLSILGVASHRYADDPDDEDCDDLLELCLFEAAKAPLSTRQAMPNDWCLSLSCLASVDTPTARDGFELLAAGLHASLLDSPSPHKETWRATFAKAGGKLRDLARQVDAFAEKEALIAQQAAKSPLAAILATARLAPSRRPGL